MLVLVFTSCPGFQRLLPDSLEPVDLFQNAKRKLYNWDRKYQKYLRWGGFMNLDPYIGFWVGG